MTSFPRCVPPPAVRLLACLMPGLLGWTAGAMAQKPDPAIEAAVGAARARVAQVQQGLVRSDSTFWAFDAPNGVGTITAFREAGALRKLLVRFNGDGASWRAEYVYWEDSLVFAYRRWDRFPERGESRFSEDRWYVAGGRAVRWLRRDEDGTRRTRHTEDPEFANEARIALAVAACWRRVEQTRPEVAPC